MLEPRLPGRVGSWGGIARDNRSFIDSVFRIMRTDAPWRDLPTDYYSDRSNTHCRLVRQGRVGKAFRNLDRQA
ncbi:MAG: hypothetical protein HRT36_07265 [Alphaproteobacteria bacterium]|nr:hypothetical protein [Alphaproteobacteria bacterium]